MYILSNALCERFINIRHPHWYIQRQVSSVDKVLYLSTYLVLTNIGYRCSVLTQCHSLTVNMTNQLTLGVSMWNFIILFLSLHMRITYLKHGPFKIPYHCSIWMSVSCPRALLYIIVRLMFCCLNFDRYLMAIAFQIPTVWCFNH